MTSSQPDRPRWAVPALRALLVTAGLLPWLVALSPTWSRAALPVFRSLGHQRPERMIGALRN